MQQPHPLGSETLSMSMKEMQEQMANSQVRECVQQEGVSSVRECRERERESGSESGEQGREWRARGCIHAIAPAVSTNTQTKFRRTRTRCSLR
jgi:hypothetical protein